MDIKKAQRLITRIQTFLDHGSEQEISRLEKDLIKSYVVQLYDVITGSDEVKHEPEQVIEFVEHKMPKREPKVETPPVVAYTPPKTEYIPPKTEYIQPKTEYVKPQYTEPIETTLREKFHEADPPVPPIHKLTPFDEMKPVHHHASEPIRETVEPAKIHSSSHGSNENLAKLFDISKSDEMSGRFSHVPISSIESAMGLNERIFTLNELFGGNKALFDSTCAKLNNYNSFAEAKTMLMNGPAAEYDWSSPEHQKMAEQFIRIVSRRYPKSV